MAISDFFLTFVSTKTSKDMEIVRDNYKIKDYYDIVGTGDVEEGVDIYDAVSGEWLNGVAWASCATLEEMSDDEFSEWVFENV